MPNLLQRSASSDANRARASASVTDRMAIKSSMSWFAGDAMSFHDSSSAVASSIKLSPVLMLSSMFIRISFLSFSLSLSLFFRKKKRKKRCGTRHERMWLIDVFRVYKLFRVGVAHHGEVAGHLGGGDGLGDHGAEERGAQHVGHGAAFLGLVHEQRLHEGLKGGAGAHALVRYLEGAEAQEVKVRQALSHVLGARDAGEGEAPLEHAVQAHAKTPVVGLERPYQRPAVEGLGGGVVGRAYLGMVQRVDGDEGGVAKVGDLEDDAPVGAVRAEQRVLELQVAVGDVEAVQKLDADGQVDGELEQLLPADADVGCALHQAEQRAELAVLGDQQVDAVRLDLEVVDEGDDVTVAAVAVEDGPLGGHALDVGLAGAPVLEVAVGAPELLLLDGHAPAVEGAQVDALLHADGPADADAAVADQRLHVVDALPGDALKGRQVVVLRDDVRLGLRRRDVLEGGGAPGGFVCGPGRVGAPAPGERGEGGRKRRH